MSGMTCASAGTAMSSAENINGLIKPIFIHVPSSHCSNHRNRCRLTQPPSNHTQGTRAGSLEVASVVGGNVRGHGCAMVGCRPHGQVSSLSPEPIAPPRIADADIL